MEVLQRTANRGSISTGYDIDNSLKLESDNSERVNKAAATISGAGNRRTFTISFWTKRTEINGVKQYLFEAGNSDADNDRFTLRFGTGDTFDIQSQSTWLITNRKFRDTSAWYHFVIKVDTTDGTAADRMKLYVNGVEETSFSTDNRSSINQNHDFAVNNTEDHIIGNSQIEGSAYYNGYITEWIQLDGTAAAPTSFGEFDEDNGIWKPKDPSALSFGTNGFWLDFEDSSNLGNDKSGGTDFTLTNITAADQATDTPTNNFATFNVQHPRATNTTIAEGGTEMYVNSNYQTAVSSIAVSKGKWYAEFIAGGGNAMVGFVDVTEWTIPQLHNGYWLGYDGTGNTLSVGMKGSDGVIYNESNSATGATFGNADVISVALDMDNRKAYFAVNGTWVNSGNPATAANPILWYTQRADGTPWTDVITMGITGNSNTYPRCNFGGYSSVVPSSPQSDSSGYGTFEYAPPSGFYALCTKNLAEYG